MSFPNCWNFKPDCHRVTRKACCNSSWLKRLYCFTCKIHTVSSIIWKIIWLQSAWLHYVIIHWRSLILWDMLSLLSSRLLHPWWLAQCRTLAAVSSTPPLVVSMTGQRGPFLRLDVYLLKKCADDQVALLHSNGKLEHHRTKLTYHNIKYRIIISVSDVINNCIWVLYIGYGLMDFHDLSWSLPP